MKVDFVVPYPPDLAPGQRFRFEQWLRLLPDGAIDAQLRPLFDETAYRRLYQRGGVPFKVGQSLKGAARRVRDAVAARHADVVFLYREAFALGPPIVEWLIERRVPVVYDFDDAIFLRDTSPANALISSLKFPNKVQSIVAGATTTTVANRYLADYARRFSPRVEVIPTTIDIQEYQPRPKEDKGPVRIGWSGSPTTSRHLRDIEAALRRMLDELPVELVVIGDPDFRLDGADRVQVRPWRREEEIDQVGAFDIGLMPLPDDEWSKGKAGFKALLYMSLGVAPVVSPVGVNTEIVTHDLNGLIASSEEEWVTAVARLVEDAELRKSLGQHGRETVVNRYSGQQWAPRFLEVLKAAADTRRP